MEKKQYISPSYRVHCITLKSFLMSISNPEAQLMQISDALDGNQIQGTDFVVETRGENNLDVWDESW